MSTTESHFSEAYADRLFRQTATFSEELDEMALPLDAEARLELIRQLDDFKYAESSTQSGETIPYVRVGNRTARPVLYVPGFTEGIEAKAPFAIELAKRGMEVILPGQNRTKILKDAVTSTKDATYSQAENYLDVLHDYLKNRRAEAIEVGVVDEVNSFDVITHSYGSLIFEKMDQLAAQRGLRYFKEMNVIMLAPAGLNEKESTPRLLGRFLKMMISESKSAKDFEDEGGEMFKAGLKNALANIPRAFREGRELAQRRIDFRTLASSLGALGAGQLKVLSYGEDKLYSEEVLEPTMRQAMAEGFAWAVPVSLRSTTEDLRNGQLRGRDGATHNDEQFNPARVAGAAALILRGYGLVSSMTEPDKKYQFTVV